MAPGETYAVEFDVQKLGTMTLEFKTAPRTSPVTQTIDVK